MKQTHTRPGETATGCVSKVLSLQITLSRPACWMASNFNWIRTRAKKFSTTRQQPRQTIQITRIDSASKKKENPRRNDPDSRGNGFIPAVLAPMGFRVIPIQRTPKYPRALSSCIMHTEPAAAEATSPIYRGAWLLSAAGRGPPRPRSLSLSLSLSEPSISRYFIFRLRLNSATLTSPLPPSCYT